MPVSHRVPEIGLRIAEVAWRGRGDQEQPARRSFVGYVCDRAHLAVLLPDRPQGPLSPEEAHSLALIVLARFWNPDRPCTAVVTNITMKEDGPRLYLVRPPSEGAVTAGYGTEHGLPAFRCQLQNGFFLAVGFEVDRYGHDTGAHDLVLSGPAYHQTPPAPGDPFVPTRPPRPLPDNVLAALTGLESRRRRLSLLVAEWQRFVDWQMDLVRRRQVGLRYEDVDIDTESKRLRFHVRAPSGDIGRFQRLRAFDAQAMPRRASKDPSRWVPVERVRGLALGEMRPREALVEGPLTETQTEDDGPQTCLIETRPDWQDWEDAAERIPEEGFLCNSIYMDIAPLMRQRRALQRLVRGEHVNPRLSDILFDATAARTPDGPVMPLACLPDGLSLNDLQRRAVAKALAAGDLFLLQGPPGTGKTTVIVDICARAIREGKRVLVASQANVAVENVLARLPRCPEVRPLRVEGKDDGDETASPFGESAVVLHWLATVREVAETRQREDADLVASRATIERTWPRLEQMAAEAPDHQRTRHAQREVVAETQAQSAALTTELSRFQERAADLGVASRALETARDELRDGRAGDLGEWVQWIAADARADVFASLSDWRKTCAAPQALSPFLQGDREPTDETPDERRLGWWTRLFRHARRWFSDKADRDAREASPTEPNWAVEWIEANALLGQVRTCAAGLPSLLSASEEAERVCAAAGRSAVSDGVWLQAGRALCQALEPLGGRTVAEGLGITDISTALGPKPAYRKRLGTARATIGAAIEAATRIAADLSAALLAVATACRDHVNGDLSETTTRIAGLRTDISALNEKQGAAAEAGNEAEEALRHVEGRWREALSALPADSVDGLEIDGIEPGSPGLAALAHARDRHFEATDDRLERHRLWGPIRAEWIRLLERAGDADRERLAPLYVKRCNVVGATCSYCGKGGAFLGRDEFGRFDIVIIDEVSKATPPELLIAALLAKKLILVGDYRQLGPTFKETPRRERTFDELAELDQDFDQITRFREMVTASLFKTLVLEAPDVLKQYVVEQHRMHPQIMEVVNQFYDNQLVCGIPEPGIQCDHGLTIRTRRGDLLTRGNHVLWVDASRNRHGRCAWERQVGTSKANHVEAACIARLVALLNEAARSAGRSPRETDVGIITFYGAQAALIRRKISDLNPSQRDHLDLRVNTVDSFQGAERSIVIVSLVRSTRGTMGAFARQYERINVAMSRAQKLLIILGAADTFAQVEVCVPDRNERPRMRRCYSHILDVVRKYGGLRSVKDLY